MIELSIQPNISIFLLSLILGKKVRREQYIQTPLLQPRVGFTLGKVYPLLNNHFKIHLGYLKNNDGSSLEPP